MVLVDVVRAVYLRTLRPGVTDDALVAAWMPPHHTRDSYPARVSISHDANDERRVLTVIDVDAAPAELPAMLPDLVHPDSEARLAEVVTSTDVAALFVETVAFGR
jgi:hypothetical protein